MKVAVVGLGNQGRKRIEVAGNDVVCTVDPYIDVAQYRDIEQVPLSAYEAAMVCASDEAKWSIVEYLVANGKHVLVEKPMLTPDDERFIRLRDLAAEQGVACYTAYNHRFEPHIAALKGIVDSGRLGDIYVARISYGNGTARDVRDTWRDTGMGVLADLGSHLLDMVHFLFADADMAFEARSLKSFENKAYDYVNFGSTGSPLVALEATMLSWRNSFSLDLLGAAGSAHIDCLCKWGPSTLTVRGRKLPSGKPDEECKILECADPTWEAEYLHFKERCLNAESNIDNDIRINEVLQGLARSGIGAAA